MVIKRSGVNIISAIESKSKNKLIVSDHLKILKDKKYIINNVEVSLLKEIDNCVNNTIHREYIPEFKYKKHYKLKNTNIEVYNEKTVKTAIKLLGKGIDNIVSLNFANGTNVGGGFLAGASAQEEDLCKCSALYESLKSKPQFYNKNILENNHYYTNDTLYSPNVPFFKNENYDLLEKIFTMSVISSPAPNVSLMKEDEFSLNRINNTILNRIYEILHVAHINNHKNIILGAWGCGAFGNDPYIISHAFYQVLNDFSFDNIYFSVYDNRENQLLFNIFKEKLK